MVVVVVVRADFPSTFSEHVLLTGRRNLFFKILIAIVAFRLGGFGWKRGTNKIERKSVVVFQRTMISWKQCATKGESFSS